MSIQSVEDFDPKSSTPVFGSTVSQTKIQQQQQPTNDLEGAEKLVTPPKPVVNGQIETANNKNSDNLGNGTTVQSVNGNNGTTDSTDVHVNGQNEKKTDEKLSSTTDNVNSAEESVSKSGASDPIENSSQNNPLPASSNEPTDTVTSTLPPVDPPAPTEPEPALSTSANVANEDLKSAVPTNAPPVPAPPVETSSTSNEDVPASATAPEATVLAESATPERKAKSPRGKAKSPVVSTPPTRQSTRAKKPVSPPPTTEEEEEEQATEDTGASTTNKIQSSSPSKRTKRQAASLATDAIQASNQPTSTSEEVNDPTDPDVIPSDIDDDYDATSSTKKKTPSPRKGRASTSAGKKRGASSSPSVSASKKTKTTPKGKKSTTLDDEQQMDVDIIQGKETTATPAAVVATNESEPVQTPPKKARTSGNKKTPTSTPTTPESSGDYLRKLRPRK